MTPKTRLALLMAGVVVLSVVVGVLVLRRPSGPLKPADPLELLPDRCQAV
ncbi:MAG: hypothetical protein HY901_05315, partial [Deltaproteobacteria bacterium]|nr:hypothetical protein [Deltaproteobacteria bacterium]